MTTILRAESAHDFLALIPTLAGYRPRRSLVWVAFHGNRTAGVIRFDLPRRAADREPVVTAGIGMLCRLDGVDAVVPIAYTDARFAGRGGAGARALLRIAIRRAEEAGFHVRDGFVVAGDAWASVRDRTAPPDGYELALIESATSHREAGGRRGPADPSDSTDLAELITDSELPLVDRPEADEVARVVHLLSDAGAGGGRARAREREALLERLGGLADPVECIELALAGEEARAPLDAVALGWLAHLAGRPAYRDAMMLQIAFGRMLGEVALDEAVVDLPEEELDDGPAAPLDDGQDASHREVAELLGDLLLGLSTHRPDVDRVRCGFALFRRVAAAAPAEHRAGALCVAAWLAWSLGRGSVAGALLDRALEATPGHPMAALLTTYLGTGALPEWAFAAVARPGGGGDGAAPLSGRRGARSRGR
ncbi:DUF4192 family protein [Agromyces agglutinans]|nr:DUF4192 family protein [Agromyces agglutinans]